MPDLLKIGLQAGKMVASAVDKFIEDMHAGKNEDKNFDPVKRKQMQDESVVYLWCIKGRQGDTEYEVGLMDTLERFNDENLDLGEYSSYFEDELTAVNYGYKVISKDNRGKSSVCSNSFGGELFDELFLEKGIVFPKEWEDAEAEKETSYCDVVLMTADRTGATGAWCRKCVKILKKLKRGGIPLVIHAEDGKKAVVGFITAEAALKFTAEKGKNFFVYGHRSALGDFVLPIIDKMDTKKGAAYEHNGARIWIEA